MSAALIAKLIEAGTPAALVAETAMELGRAEAAKEALARSEAVEAAKREAKRQGNRERQQRKRENDRNAESRVTSVTARDERDQGSNDRDILTSKEDLPQEANASLPQGAKRTKSSVPWPCPDGVEPRHWADLLANRKRKKCAQTQTALDGVLSDIAKFADDEWPPGRLVKHAAAKGWASINDPRDDYGKRPHSDRKSGWETAFHANMGSGGYS